MPKPLTALSTYVSSPDDWIIPHILKRRNTGFVIGRPKKAAKSWLLFNLGWDLATGANCWQVSRERDGELLIPPRPMRVCYFTQEDTEGDLYDRFKLMVAAGRIPTNDFWYEPKNLNLMLDNGPGELEIMRVLDKVAPVDLVMLDPMRRLHAFNENDSEHMSRFWRSVNNIQTRYNCSCLFSHHITKPTPLSAAESDPFSARGSGDIFGGADAFINVVPRPQRGNPAKGQLKQPLTLHFVSKRGKPLLPIDLTVDFQTGLVNFDGFTP
jgi:RecA-family ATPase